MDRKDSVFPQELASSQERKTEGQRRVRRVHKGKVRRIQCGRPNEQECQEEGKRKSL